MPSRQKGTRDWSQDALAARQNACERLSRVAQILAEQHRGKLEEGKIEERHLERPDFVWHYLIQTLAVMGNSRGYGGLILNLDNYNRVTFEALSRLSPTDRLRVLKETLHAAKVRMPDKKAAWLAKNFRRIESMGGPAAAKADLFSKRTREAKIAFMERFEGIGPANARNIFMAVYDPDFRQSVKVDERIRSISEVLGVSFSSYDEHEQFYLDVAAKAGLNGWELDRLLYNFKDEVLAKLRQKAAAGVGARTCALRQHV
jgi:hypothetical protein